ALRYFNVFGPRQSLSNPYTGVAAIFTARLLADESPPIFEDGKQTRDFVHVPHVARAHEPALTKREADGQGPTRRTRPAAPTLAPPRIVLSRLGPNAAPRPAPRRVRAPAQGRRSPPRRFAPQGARDHGSRRGRQRGRLRRSRSLRARARARLERQRRRRALAGA